jgi:hypothetical protein
MGPDNENDYAKILYLLDTEIIVKALQLTEKHASWIIAKVMQANVFLLFSVCV